MKKLITILAMLLVGLMVEAQTVKDSVYIVETPFYIVHYSYTKEQPLHLEYQLNCIDGEVPRYSNFWTDPRWHTSDDKDYANNPWDKGHLAPAASFNCTPEMMKLSFSYLNCALQHESLNRGVWASLEGWERDLSVFYNVSVSIDVIFDENCKRLGTGATVPKGFRKTIYWDGRKVTFYFPNKKLVGRDWNEFIINH